MDASTYCGGGRSSLARLWQDIDGNSGIVKRTLLTRSINEVTTLFSDIVVQNVELKALVLEPVPITDRFPDFRQTRLWFPPCSTQGSWRFALLIPISVGSYTERVRTYILSVNSLTRYHLWSCLRYSRITLRMYNVVTEFILFTSRYVITSVIVTTLTKFPSRTIL